MPQLYNHLFFDLDHTLWDFERNAANTLRLLFQEYRLEEAGIPNFEKFWDAYVVHNDSMWARFRAGTIRREDLRWKRIQLALLDFKIGDTALAYEMSAAYLELLPTQTLLNPYAKELLEHCQGRYAIHIITNGFETTQWQKLHFSGISSYFKEVITSERSERPKPHREIFDYALSVTGAEVRNSIMIGDALEIDIMGAMSAGWDTAYYNPKHQKHTCNPTFEVVSLKDLIGIF